MKNKGGQATLFIGIALICLWGFVLYLNLDKLTNIPLDIEKVTPLFIFSLIIGAILTILALIRSK